MSECVASGWKLGAGGTRPSVPSLSHSLWLTARCFEIKSAVVSGSYFCRILMLRLIRYKRNPGPGLIRACVRWSWRTKSRNLPESYKIVSWVMSNQVVWLGHWYGSFPLPSATVSLEQYFQAKLARKDIWCFSKLLSWNTPLVHIWKYTGRWARSIFPRQFSDKINAVLQTATRNRLTEWKKERKT